MTDSAQNQSPSEPGRQELRDLVRTSMDYDYYIESYPELAHLGPVEAADHYYHEGFVEQRDPTRWFSTSYYLKEHTAVAESGQNPFLHFLIYGRAEGKYPSFAAAASAAENSEARSISAQAVVATAEQQARWARFAESYDRKTTERTNALFVVDDAVLARKHQSELASLRVSADVDASITTSDLASSPAPFPFADAGTIGFTADNKISAQTRLHPRPDLVVAIGLSAAINARSALWHWKSTTLFAFGIDLRPEIAKREDAEKAGDLSAIHASERRLDQVVQVAAEFDALVAFEETDEELFSQRLLLGPIDTMKNPGIDGVQLGAGSFQILGWLH